MAARTKSVRRSAVTKSPAPAAGKKLAKRQVAVGKTPGAGGKTRQAGKPAVGKAPVRKSLGAGGASRKKVTPQPGPAPARPPRKLTPAPRRVSLGRPRVVGEELLDLVFKEDFHARQIFVFLGVRTVRELEEFGPQQILDKAAQPLKETVDRIRARLAMLNRALRDDQEFALRFLEQFAAESSS
ncbi:MAG TPA: hypothetical protein DDY91_08985 [Planctomycetaceae bacterium]|nr:hypothetical protein [Planctomycetaceae bacterium]